LFTAGSMALLTALAVVFSLIVGLFGLLVAWRHR
jgi:hypothetical protein